MKQYLYFILSLFCCNVAIAQTVYLTDTMNFNLRSGEGSQYKLLKTLPSGTPLTLLSENKANGYSKVKTSDGTIGYLPTRFTVDQPVSSLFLEKTKKQLETLKAENDQLKASLSELKTNNVTTVSSNEELLKERDQLSTDLKNLRYTAANAIEIQRQRDDLQERVVMVERELQQLKRDKQALEDSTNQDWFLYGGFLAFLGIFFGLMIPKISWNRRSHGGWDSL